MKKYQISEEEKKNFNENLNYILKQINSNLKSIDNMKQDFYFEMSKEQIKNSFNGILITLNKWKYSFNENYIYDIQKEYKEIESNISQLELCLCDYDNIFHCSGVSYALFQMGNILIEILKNDKEMEEYGK